MRSSHRHGAAPLYYRPEIDGLRAIAVLGVIGFHAFPEWVQGGYAGVDVFFVISGYLITGIIMVEADSGAYSHTAFYAHRIRRLFPSLIVVLCACLIAGWFVLLDDEYEQLCTHVVMAASFLSNAGLLREAGYFDAAAVTKPLLHLWSLGIEAQFYLLWPFLLLRAIRNNAGPALVALVAATSLVLHIELARFHADADFYLPFSRLWEFMAGAMVYITAKPVMKGGISRIALQALGLMLLAAAMFMPEGTLFAEPWRVPAAVVASSLLLVGSPDGTANRGLLAAPLPVAIGLLSYPLYLWHWPILSFLHIVHERTPAAPVRAVALLISVLLAWLTFRLAEKPLRAAGQNLYAVAYSLVLLLAVIGYISFKLAAAGSRNALETRFEVSVSRDLETPEEPGTYAVALAKYAQLLVHDPNHTVTLDAERAKAVRELQCHVTAEAQAHYDHGILGDDESGLEHCLAVSPAGKNILVIGDSHAADLFAALVRTHRDIHFLGVTNPGCSIQDDASRECAELLNYALDFTRSHKLDAVILASRWLDSQWLNPRLARRNYIYLEGVVAKLKHNGQKVIIAGPAVHYIDDAGVGLSSVIMRKPRNVEFSNYMDSYIVAAYGTISDGLRKFAARQGISYIDRIYYYCQYGCQVLDADGNLLIIDGAHLSVEGEPFLGNALFKEKVLEKILLSPEPLQLPKAIDRHWIPFTAPAPASLDRH